MKQSLIEFLKWYNKEDFSRFHMPGHKASAPFLKGLGEKNDITEIYGADCLYQSSGVLEDLESSMSELYESDCYLSTGGCTLSIQTAITLCKDRKIFAARSSHASFFNVSALLDIDPVFLPVNISPDTGLVLPPSANEVEDMLKNCLEPAAVYITSPDYWGQTADVKSIASVCKKNNALLIVDSAHGAHQKFLYNDVHPIALGADICCDSLHKTLPTLTGAAAIHIKPGLFTKEEVKAAFSLFGSTSPSYLILASIAHCCEYLKKQGRTDFSLLEEKKKRLLKEVYIPNIPTDCSRLTIDSYKLGYTGEELGDMLRKNKIELEWAGGRYVILMLSPFLRGKDWKRLKRTFSTLSNHPVISSDDIFFEDLSPIKRLSLKEAVFAKKEFVPISEALGKVCGQTIFSCPPGIPFVLAGEEITENICKSLKKSGVFQIYVIK